MNDDLTSFYSTTAQVIPVLLILLVVETSFAASIITFRGIAAAPPPVRQNVEHGLRVFWRVAGLLSPGSRGLEPIVDFYLVRPRRLSNILVALGTIVWPLLGEIVSLASLPHPPAGRAQAIVLVIIGIAVGLLC